jgi:hypothetical protein
MHAGAAQQRADACALVPPARSTGKGAFGACGGTAHRALNRSAQATTVVLRTADARWCSSTRRRAWKSDQDEHACFAQAEGIQGSLAQRVGLHLKELAAAPHVAPRAPGRLRTPAPRAKSTSGVCARAGWRRQFSAFLRPMRTALGVSHV